MKSFSDWTRDLAKSLGDNEVVDEPYYCGRDQWCCP